MPYVVAGATVFFISSTSIEAATGSVSYSYDALGRLVQVTYDDGTTTTYTYDANGNRISVVTEQPSQ
jgi:YD repeat-containing protein